MIKINKKIFFTLIVTISIKSNITQKENWQIFTPSKELTLTTKEKRKGSCKELAILGDKANKYWQKTRSSQNTINKLEKTFRVVSPEYIIDIINEILTNNSLLEKVTQASYKNATGFLKIVLIANENKEWKIRLHVWNKNEKEHPHNHKWDFYSKILSGYLIQDIYEESDNENATLYHICEPVSLMPLLSNGEKACPCRDSYVLSEKKSSCNLTQSLFLRNKSKDIIGTSESYFMPNNLIHTISSGINSVTFVFTSNQVSENSEVFVSDEKINSDLKKYAPSVTKEELKIELERVKSILQKKPVSREYLPEMLDLEHKYFEKKDPLFNTNSWRGNLSNLKSEKTVLQLSEDEKNKCILDIKNKKILIGGKDIEPSSEYLFVLNDGIMHASLKDFHHSNNNLICHTSFTDYSGIDAAGVLHFDENKNLIRIEAYSGHYSPSVEDMQKVTNFLNEKNYPTENIKVSNFEDRK